MLANGSLIVNVLLYISAFVGVGYCLKMLMQFWDTHFLRKRPRKHRLLNSKRLSSRQGKRYAFGAESEAVLPADEIIAVRKVAFSDQPTGATGSKETAVTFQFSSSTVRVDSSNSSMHRKGEKTKEELVVKQQPNKVKQHLMMFLLAKENRQLKGYEVLQTILAIGLRFGEGDLFHRFDDSDKHAPTSGAQSILCSLATATQTGSFDLNNMGAFQTKGLCLFMAVSGNVMIDEARFKALYQTALQLRDGLDVHLLDDRRQPLTEKSFKHYEDLLGNEALTDLYEPLEPVSVTV